MARKPALTMRLVDEIGVAITEARRMALEDGVVTMEEQAHQRRLRRLAKLAERVDEARLNAISYLDHGELTVQRKRRARELATDDDFEPEVA